MLFRRSMLIAGVRKTTWRFNPADKNASIVLTNGDRTITQSSGGATGVRGTTSKSSGKWYTEIRYDGVFGAGAFGFGTSGHSLNGDVGSGTGFGYSAGGTVSVNGSTLATLAQYASGTVIGVAVDFAALKVWFSANGVWLSGNPVTGSGGYSFTAGTYFPMASIASTGGYTILDALAYSPPSGFGGF